MGTVAGKVDVLDLPLKSQEAPDFLINALVLRPHGFKLPTPKAIIHMLPRIWNLTKGLTIKTVPQVPDLYLCLFDEEAVRDKSSSWRGLVDKRLSSLPPEVVSWLSYREPYL